jgi:hypothetical protein
MSLADDQNMIQALTPKASDQAFSSAGDLHRQICRLLALENAIDVAGRLLA